MNEAGVYIKIDQAGLGAGVAGKARTDGLDTGALVTLTDTSPPGMTTRFRLLWVGLGDTTSVATLAATGNPKVWTFSPTAACYGSWIVELIRDEGLATEEKGRRVFGVRLPVSGLLIPALNERADGSASLANAGADVINASDNNADDYSEATLNALRYAGWWRMLAELHLVVENGGGGGTVDSDQVINVSDVPGANVSDALDELALEANEALRRSMRWVDDFDTNELAAQVAASTTTVIGTSRGNWILGNGSQITNVVQIPGELNAPGILQFRLAANSTSFFSLYRGQRIGAGIFVATGAVRADQVFRQQFVVRIPDITQFGFRLSLTDGGFPESATNTMAFLYDTAVNAQVLAVTRAPGGTGQTATPVGVPPQGQFVRFTIQQTVAGVVEFYIGSTLVATHTGAGQNVPVAAALSCVIQAFTKTNSARNFDLDFAAFESQPLTGLPPSPAIAAQVNYAVRDDANVYNVGKASWMYPTVEAAIAAINATLPAPSNTNRKIIRIWPGRYVSTATMVLPAFVAILGQPWATVELANDVADLFHLSGDNVIDNVRITGNPNSASIYAFRGNNNRFLKFSNVLFDGTGAFLLQSGNSWFNLEFDGVLINTQQPNGYAITLEDTSGTSRGVDTWAHDCNWDNIFMPAGGGGIVGGVIRLIGVSDVRIMSSFIRATAAGASLAQCVDMVGNCGAGNFPVRINNSILEGERGIASQVGSQLFVTNTDAANSTAFLLGTVTARNSFLT